MDAGSSQSRCVAKALSLQFPRRQQPSHTDLHDLSSSPGIYSLLRGILTSCNLR